MWPFQCCIGRNATKDTSIDTNSGSDTRAPYETDLLIAKTRPSEHVDTPQEVTRPNSSGRAAKSSHAATMPRKDALEAYPRSKCSSSSMMQLAIEQRKVRRDHQLKGEMSDHYMETPPKGSGVSSTKDNYLIRNGSHDASFDNHGSNE